MIKEKSKRETPVDEIPDADLPKSYTLRQIPAEIYRIVMKEQAAIKLKKGTNLFSFESTIYKMLRDYEKCRKVSENFKPEES